MSYFVYDALPCPKSQIRLVILEPGKRYESVHCHLRTVSSANLEPYEALSYCWGPPPVTNTIFVNGKSLQVSPNLEHALRNLRYSRSKKRTLWIDAICIDQKKYEEKSAQVPRMGEIFKSASQVLVWIGRDHEPEDEVLDWDPIIWGFSKREKGTNHSTSSAWEFIVTLAMLYDFQVLCNRFDSELEPAVAKYIISKRNCVADLSRLVRRNWFRRLWTIQEVVLATTATVICGRQCIPWSTLKYGAKCLASIAGRLTRNNCLYLEQTAMQPILHIQNITNCMRTDNICRMLFFTQANPIGRPPVEVTLQSDRLFGLIGMVTDNVDIVVDYKIGYKEVYINWSKKFILRTKSLDILSLCEDSSARGFPSWVPDLSHRFATDKLLFESTYPETPTGSTFLPINNAAGSQRGFPCVNMSTNSPSSILCLLAIRLESIFILAPYINGPDTTARYSMLDGITGEPIKSRMAHIESLLIPPALARINTKSKSKIADMHLKFAKTVFHGLCASGGEILNTEYPLLAEQYEQWRGRSPPANEKRPDALPQDIENFQHMVSFPNIAQLINVLLREILLFVTENGVFGAVSSNCHVKEGDEIFLLQGAKTPFVLRRNDVGRYKLMGPCYLCEAMHGERATSGWGDGINNRPEGVREIEII